jgi:uncharacterized protein YjiS (DUF1127 family)
MQDRALEDVGISEAHQAYIGFYNKRSRNAGFRGFK